MAWLLVSGLMVAVFFVVFRIEVEPDYQEGYTYYTLYRRWA